MSKIVLSIFVQFPLKILNKFSILELFALYYCKNKEFFLFHYFCIPVNFTFLILFNDTDVSYYRVQKYSKSRFNRPKRNIQIYIQTCNFFIINTKEIYVRQKKLYIKTASMFSRLNFLGNMEATFVKAENRHPVCQRRSLHPSRGTLYSQRGTLYFSCFTAHKHLPRECRHTSLCRSFLRSLPNRQIRDIRP